MKVAIVPVGNSKGIRIPKIILEQCHIKESVELETKGEVIVIKPFKREPRKDWEQAFKEMHENRDDRLMIDDYVDLNIEDWEW